MAKTYLTLPNLTEQEIHKFWTRVQINRTDECWPWISYRLLSDYGVFRIQSGQWRSHRLAYLLHYGVDPAGLNVLHSCDNPPCCNPLHLSLGTQTDNMRDASRKNRLYIPSLHGQAPKGDTHPHAKLKESDIKEIRQMYASGEWLMKDIAARFGVSRPTISDVITGRQWSHVS